MSCETAVLILVGTPLAVLTLLAIGFIVYVAVKIKQEE